MGRFATLEPPKSRFSKEALEGTRFSQDALDAQPVDIPFEDLSLIADPSEPPVSVPEIERGPAFEVALERTTPQKIGDFFIGKPEDRPFLPSGAGRIEKINHAIRSVTAMPLRAFIKYSKGLLLGTPELAFAAIKKITPDDLWEEGVKDMTLDEAMDWAMGWNPSGFSKTVSGLTEFVGAITTVRGVLGPIPKSATTVDKALRLGETFALAKMGRELSRFGAELIDPETDYQYEGAAGILTDFGIGAGFSLLGTASKPVLRAIAKTPAAKAISDAGHRVVIELTKRFPVLADTVRKDPSAYFTKQILRSAKRSGIDIKKLSIEQKIVLKHVAREAERKFVQASRNFTPPPDIVKRRPRLITGKVEPTAIAPITPPAAPPVTKVPAKPAIILPKAPEAKPEVPVKIGKPIPAVEPVVKPIPAIKVIKPTEKIPAKLPAKQVQEKVAEIQREIVKPVEPTKIVSPAEVGPARIVFKAVEGLPATKLIVEPKLRRQAQVFENKIAKLKTTIAQAKADKKVDVANALIKQRNKLQTQLAEIKERAKVKLTEVQRKNIAANVKTMELQKELFNLVESSLPPSAQRQQALRLLTKISPLQRPRTNLRNFGAAIVKVGELVRQQRKRQAISEFKNIGKILREKFGTRKNPIGKLRPEFQTKIIGLIEGIDPAKITSRKRKDLLSLQNKITQLSKSVASASEDFNRVDPDLTNKELTELLKIPDSRIRQLRRLGQKSIRDMTTEDIETLSDSINSLVRQNELKNKIITERGLRELTEVESKSRSEIIPTRAAKKGIVKQRGIFGRIFKTNASTMPTFIHESFGDIDTTSGKFFFFDIMEGIDSERMMLRDAQKIVQDGMKKAGISANDIKNWVSKKHDFIINNKKIELSETQLISILLHTRNSDNFRALQRGLKWKKERRIFKTGPLNFEQIATLLEPLTEKHRVFADITNDILDNFTAPKMNKISLRLEGFEKFKEKFYWPIRRVLPAGLGGAKAKIVPLSERSFTKERIGGLQPIWLTDVLSELTHSLQESSAYANLMIPLYNAKSIAASKNWQESMENSGRLDAMLGIIDKISIVEGIITDRDALGILAGRILRGYTRKALGINLSSFVAQTASEPLLSAVDPVEYVKHRLSFSEELQNEINEHSGYLWFRKTARRPTREIGDVAASGSTMQFFTNKNPVLNKPMAGLTIFDNSVMQKTWKMAKGHVDKTGIKKGTEQYWKAVRKRLYELLITQPNWHPFLRSKQLNSTNAFKRTFFMFRSAREAIHNMALRANAGVANKVPNAKKQWGLTAIAIAASIMVYRTIKEIFWKGFKKMPEWLGIGKTPTKKEDANVMFDISEKLLYDIIALAPLGNFIKIIVSVPIKVFKGKPIYRWSPQTPITEVPEILAKDITFNLAQTVKHFETKDRFQSGSNKGRLKWEIFAQRAGMGTTEFVSIAMGLPFIGVKAIISPTIKAALSKEPEESVF